MDIGFDWMVNILPAVRTVWQGGNPYDLTQGFDRVLFPVWTYVWLGVFMTPSYMVGRIMLFCVSLAAFAYTAHRLGASRVQWIFFLFSSPVLACLYNANMDWMVLLGMAMPPWLGLFFVLIKPQLGIGVALYWMVIAWKWGGWKPVVKMFAPVTLAYMLTFVLYGPWFLHYLGMQDNPANFSGFPYTVPLALVLWKHSLHKMERVMPMTSSLLLAPYTSLLSYSGMLLALLQRPKLFYLAWGMLWIPIAMDFWI